MALLFRKQHVISSIRAAYLLRHHDNGLVVDDTLDSLGSYEPGDADLTNLSLRLQTDTSAENLTQILSRSPTSPSTPVSVSSDAAQLAAASAPAGGLSDTREQPPTIPHLDRGPPLELEGYGMHLDDDSDFEDDLLSVAQEMNLQPEPKHQQRRSTSDSDLRSRRSTHSSPSKNGYAQTTSPNVFMKRDPSVYTASEASQLTSQLTATTRDPREQYLEAVAGLGNDGKPGVRLRMHMHSKRTIDILVKNDCTGHFALGYALLKAGEAPGDANMYNLHLAEDDGEPDEDFPALDRSRPVAAYHVDELAIVHATDAEFRENSKRTPNKTSFKSKPAPAPVLKEPTPLPEQEASTTQSVHATSRLPSSFTGSLSGARSDTVALRIFMDPYDPLLSDVFWEDTMVSRQSRLNALFEQMCREKMMDTEMFVLRTVDAQHKIVNLNAVIASLFPSSAASVPQENAGTLCLEVVPRRNLPGSVNGRPRASLTLSGPTPVSTELTHESARERERKKSMSMSSGPVLPMQPLGFYKYPVLRRQQMNFLGRSERELVIDGEYVHIMPPTDWSLLDQPKTTTFHIRQVIRVKQRKVPTSFCVTVMKATGPKRYDMESKDASTTAEIVHRIQSLKNARSR